jgi:endonuclease-3
MVIDGNDGMKLVKDVSDALFDVYGEIVWIPRYNAIEELVYTILSQHTSDINSERAFRTLMEVYGDVGMIADADVSDIEKAIEKGGLAKQKAPRIKNVLNQIRKEIGSFDLSFLAEMPLSESKAWLTRLHGVGPKTAAIILCFSFGLPAMPVDTHIYRVSQRIGLIAKEVSAEAAHDLLETIIPPEEIFQFHMFLIKHGRDTCKARKPRCASCCLKGACPSAGSFG